VILRKGQFFDEGKREKKGQRVTWGNGELSRTALEVSRESQSTRNIAPFVPGRILLPCIEGGAARGRDVKSNSGNTSRQTRGN